MHACRWLAESLVILMQRYPRLKVAFLENSLTQEYGAVQFSVCARGRDGPVSGPALAGARSVAMDSDGASSVGGHSNASGGSGFPSVTDNMAGCVEELYRVSCKQ